MARRNLEVVVTIRDAASQGLDKVKDKIKETGKAADQAGVDFQKFNKTLFTTTAFIATFVKGFQALTNSLDQGAELDRLSNQYERVLGPKGRVFEAIDSLTTTTIDKMTVLQEGIKLANLGIVKDSGQIAEVFARAGTAAKMAGIDSGEGVKRFTDFMASGSVNQLEFLGLISRTNPALQAQMAVLHKTGGIMGGVISTQARLALGMNLLNSATNGQLKAQRDLADVMLLAKTNFSYLRGEVGRLLGKALAPLIEGFSRFMFKLATTIDYIRAHSKELVFLTKAAVVTAGAVIGLTGALGSLRLMVKLLSFAGIGLPGLLTSITLLGAAFLGLTSPVDGIMKKFELFGGFVKGIWELISNLDPETGLSKMSKSTYNMLKNAGLLDFAMMIARVGSTTIAVAKDIYKAVVTSFKYIDDVVGGFFNRIFTFFGSFTKDWTTWWTSDAIGGMEKFARAAMIIVGGIAAFIAGKKIFSFATGLLSKIPVIGKFFGGGGGGKGSGPSGTPEDPIYTATSLGGKAGGGMAEALKGIFSKEMFLNLGIILTSSFGQLLAMFGPVITTAITLGGVAIAGAVGYAVGTGINALLDKFTQGKTSEGFEGSIGERAIFKLSKWTGLGPANDFIKNQQQLDSFNSKSDVQLVNEQRAKQGKGPMTPEQEARLRSNTKVSPVTVPNKSEGDNTLDKIDSVGQTMVGLHGAALEQQRSVIEGALGTGSAGGKLITADEMFDIMNPGVGFLKQIAENTSKGPQNSSPVRQSPRGP